MVKRSGLICGVKCRVVHECLYSKCYTNINKLLKYIIMTHLELLDFPKRNSKNERKVKTTSANFGESWKDSLNINRKHKTIKTLQSSYRFCDNPI